MQKLLVCALVSAIASTAGADNRDIQIRSVNFQTGVIELHNFGVKDLDLTDWRFCTHDTDEDRKYTDVDGLDGITIEAGKTLFLHFNNDAADNDPDRINRSRVEGTGGAFATPLSREVYAMALYHDFGRGFVIFGNPDFMGDYLHWSPGGKNNDNANVRGGVAVNAGLWTDALAWIATDDGTSYIRLRDTKNGRLHGPKSYDVLESMPDCDSNGIDDYFDINLGGAVDANGNGVPDICECPADLDGDGDVDADDFFRYLDLFATDDPGADVNGDGVIDSDDFFDYLDAFALGC